MREPGVAQYSERVIHGEIYKARPDVMAVCHHHCPAFMPLLATGADYVPVFHLGAVGGNKPPFWDQHDEFGDTNMLVVKPEEGASLARALGRHWLVLMKRHGVTVAGTSVRDCVFRSVFSAAMPSIRCAPWRSARSAALSPGETELAGGISKQDHRRSTRSWEYWSVRGGQGRRLAGARPAQGASATAKPRRAAKGKRR